MHGLRQAPRCWFDKLASDLRDYGFIQSIPDYYLFTLSRRFDHLQVLVYVDDLIISGNTTLIIVTFKDYLSKCFHMKDLGISKCCLGILAHSLNGIYLCQRKYGLDIIKESGLHATTPASFPLEQNHHLAFVSREFYEDQKAYLQLVGCLIYPVVTLPDLYYSVQVMV